VMGETIEIKTQLAEDLWPVKADPAQINQLILNLAVNARDAMPNGGQLTLKTQNITIEPTDHAAQTEIKPGQYVQLSLSDTGVGMSQEVQDRIFEPFFTTKEFGQGAGLGLAAVYGVVKQNKGHIWVTSQPGAGTSIHIYWPSYQAPRLVSPVQSPAYNAYQGAETILLVEDEPAVREFTAHILLKQGYGVIEADSGQAALQIMKEQNPEIDLLISDMLMPGLNGKQLAQQLTLLKPEVKVLFVSGYTESTFSSQEALKTDLPMLEKPFSPMALIQKVQAILNDTLPIPPKGI
jgi:two-component system, cell cycle sensor histidine kinase and response regulator CckA